MTAAAGVLGTHACTIPKCAIPRFVSPASDLRLILPSVCLPLCYPACRGLSNVIVRHT